MKLRSTLILVSLSGLPSAAAAQELIRVSYSWLEVMAGTTTPVAAPNSIVDAGEGARISLGLNALINGTNAVGQTTTYNPPPPPGTGTVRGIGSFAYNLRGDGGAATAAGVWGLRSISSIFAFAPAPGQVLLNGALLDSFGSGQFVAPGGSANSTNPISNAFRGIWTPLSYTPRTVHWNAEPGTAVDPGLQNSILVCYGFELVDPEDPTTLYDKILNKYIASDFGSGLNIPIAPVPSTTLIATLAIVSMVRPRRRPGAAP